MRILSISSLFLVFLPTSLSCQSVSSWDDLKSAVARSTPQEQFVLCPFNIIKPEGDRIIIEDKAIGLYCEQTQKCTLVGKGDHVLIRGPRAQVILQGFVFQGASASAVVIEPTSTLQHTIRGCLFRRNRAPSDPALRCGGAIRTGVGTRLKIVSSKFTKNIARFGAAVHHEGSELVVSKCKFIANRANALAVVHLTGGARADISSSAFLHNVVKHNKRGGIINANKIGDVVVRSEVTGGDNSAACDGLALASKRRCYRFEEIPYVLGKLNHADLGISLSQGLGIELIAKTGAPIRFSSPEAASSSSSIPFHDEPDGAAVFELDDRRYVYVSNAEVRNPPRSGGVYGVEFDGNDRIRGYRPLLTGTTTRNCNGGATYWGTWISCEEIIRGQCYQVDPKGVQPPQVTVMGGPEGGFFEAFAYDDRNRTSPEFFVTEDIEDGAVRRYRPSGDAVAAFPDGGWELLHREGGTIDYLEFLPGSGDGGGTFRWTSSHQAGKDSALQHYQQVEGVLRHENNLIFVSKAEKKVYVLDLDRGTYADFSTKSQGKDLPGGGSFGDGPDQLTYSPTDGLVYFTEDGGRGPGIFAYDGKSYRAVLEASDVDTYKGDETTGWAMSPSGMSMIFALQDVGHLFQVRRVDGLPFSGSNSIEWNDSLRRRRSW